MPKPGEHERPWDLKQPEIDQPGTSGWKPSGRPEGIHVIAWRRRAPWPVWLPYLLLLGPGAVYSITATGYVLALLDAGTTGYVRHHFALWSAYTILTAVFIASGAICVPVIRARLQETWVGRVPVWVSVGVVLAACVLSSVTVAADRFNGTRTWMYCAAAAGAVLWFTLLCPGESRDVLQLRHGEDASAQGRTVYLSLIGLGLGTPLTADFILLLMSRLSSPSVIGRLNSINQSGFGSSSLHSLSSTTALVVNLMANAIEEEFAFAAIVLVLARCNTSRGWIISVAFLLRAAMHLYYGPPGLGMGVFSAVNAYALLRWRRVWPLVAAHFLYDLGAILAAHHRVEVVIFIACAEVCYFTLKRKNRESAVADA